MRDLIPGLRVFLGFVLLLGVLCLPAIFEWLIRLMMGSVQKAGGASRQSAPQFKSAHGRFFTTKDGYAGPDGAEHMRELLRQDSIDEDTLVWNERFEDSWKRRRNTEMALDSIRPRHISRIDPAVRINAPTMQERRKQWLGPVVVAGLLFWMLGGVAWVVDLFELGSKTTRTDAVVEHARKQIKPASSTDVLDDYRNISFEDFKLDGKDWAAHQTKVRIQGFFKRLDGVETLFPSGLAVAIAREYGNDAGIPLLTDDATRAVRKVFLECGDNPARPLGCPITVMAHADVCTVGNMFGSKSVPCLVVEDGQ